jgi:hypothetical protein
MCPGVVAENSVHPRIFLDYELAWTVGEFLFALATPLRVFLGVFFAATSSASRADVAQRALIHRGIFIGVDEVEFDTAGALFLRKPSLKGGEGLPAFLIPRSVGFMVI